MVLLLGLGAVLAQPAGAQSTDPYVGPTTIVSPTEPPASVSPASQAQVAPATQSRGTLPVTGTDVAGLVGIAAALILIGGVAVMVRRRLEPARA